MDLGLDIIRTSGRAAQPVAVVEVRELDAADLALLGTERGIQAQPLKRIGERHHALARLLAQGTPPGEAGLIVGLTGSRVSILRSDPTFLELVDFYRADVQAAYRDMHETLAGLSLDAANELRERLEEAPDDLTVTQLIELTKLGADRTGHGPSSTQEHKFSDGIAAKMQEARERVARRRNAEIIDVIPNEAAE